MVATDFDGERTFEEDRFEARTVFESDHMKVVLGYFREDQFIPVHAPDSDIAIVVRRGAGTVRDGDEEHLVGPDDVVVVPAGEKRGVRADEGPLEAALVTASPPSAADHELVREGLRNGEFDPTT